MTRRDLVVPETAGKLQALPMPNVRLEPGKYGMKLNIVREGNVFQRMGQWMVPVELHPVELKQAFLFAHCAVGFWSGNYAVLIRTYHEHSFRAETLGNITTAFTFFGIDGTAKPIALGVARNLSDIQTYLREKGLGIGSWFPVHQLPEHFGTTTNWTDYDVHSCLLKLGREQCRIVLVQE